MTVAVVENEQFFLKSSKEVDINLLLKKKKHPININKKTNINPRIENKLLDEDEDAIVATIVASMDYYRETKKHAKLVSITREEED